MKAEEIRIQLRDLIVTIMKKIEEKRVLQDKETMNIMRNIINIKIENMRLIKKNMITKVIETEDDRHQAVDSGGMKKNTKMKKKVNIMIMMLMNVVMILFIDYKIYIHRRMLNVYSSKKTFESKLIAAECRAVVSTTLSIGL